MNQAGQEHGHGHHGHHGHESHEKPRRQFHKDWRVWIGVILILTALGAYVLTNDEVLRPGRGPQQPVPAAPGP
ncbi:MAG TPA: hypothetical protein VMR25_14375 [Planctomycetaceae bacterium]|nr:hypothetical protein [Planctomycetaceae bacterium]